MNYYARRTKFIDKKLTELDPMDNSRKLLQNGFIPENIMGSEYESFESDAKDSDIEPLIYGNYFALHPEKVAGKMIEGSGFLNPIKVKGNIDDTIKALETMRRHTNSGYKGFAKINREANRKKDVEIQSEKNINENEPAIDDLLSTFSRMGEDAFDSNKINDPLSDDKFMQWFEVQDEKIRTHKNLRLFKKEWSTGWLYAKIRHDQNYIRNNPEKNNWLARDIEKQEEKNPEIETPQTDTLQVGESNPNVVSNVPSIIHDAEVIVEDIDNSPAVGNKTYYTVEDSVKFLNPSITDSEIKAWVWYKRLHGNPMKGWDKWYIESQKDDKNKLIYAEVETEILGNNYKPIGYVQKGSFIGLKTRFTNVYGDKTFIVCKTQEGNLVWANQSDVKEESTITVKDTSVLDDLVYEGALIYNGDEYLPIPIFIFGNYYTKLDTLKANEDAVIAKYNKDTFDKMISLLESFKPSTKSFSDPVISKRPFISVLSEMANDVNQFGVLKLSEEANIKLGKETRGWFRETQEPYSLFEAFEVYLREYVRDTDIKGTNKTNIRNYYFAKAIKFPKDSEGKDELTESQKAELIGNARFEAERLFSEFLASGISLEDRMKLDIIWNRQYNAFTNVNSIVHKVPIGYEGSAMFKAGELVIKPAQREGLAYLNIVGSGCLAYEVGFGKTACGILNIAQLMSQGKIKRPLIVVPKPTYKNWLKELFGYYSDGQRIEFTSFEGSKYFYGVLSGTKIKLNDWYNLKGKTWQRLVSEYGSEENINDVIPENTITIVTYQGFEQIGFGKNVSEKVFNSIYDALAQKSSDASEKDEAKEYQKVREILGVAQKNTMVDIDRLGIDHITVDEAHNFKNAFSGCGKDPSTGRKLFGIQANRSSRAVKMFFHTQYIQRFFGKNVTLLTATPFTNSPLEFFSMISYVGLDSLLNYNLWNIQKFFEQFVMQTVEYTVDVKGELKTKPVIKSIQNLNLFQTILFNHFHRKDNPKEAGITRPCMYELPNKDVSTLLDMTEFQKSNQLQVRALVNSMSKDNKGAVLKALAHSQNNAFSPFLATKEQPESAFDFVEKSPKVKYICDCIKSVKEYHENRGEECSGQVIYANRGVEYFDYIKEYLEDYCGFKRKLDYDGEKIDEVEIVSGGGTEKDEDWKETVKDAFNSGIVKVIIGTATIKEGVNLQERGSVIYLALPEYNPSDIQQLKGRIWRQGNMYGYVRFVVPMIVNSMDAFIWQKIEEKGARLGSIWVRSDSNVSEMHSDLSPEEIKYSLVESVEEKLKIKLDSEKNRADYDLKLCDENIKMFDKVNYEISLLKENITKAQELFLERVPQWFRLLDVLNKKVLPFIQDSEYEASDKSKAKKQTLDLIQKINDLILAYNVCRDENWSNAKDVLALFRLLEQRDYDITFDSWYVNYKTGIDKKIAEITSSQNLSRDLFDTNSVIKKRIVEYWSTIFRAEKSVFKPYGKTWSDDTDELREILGRKQSEAKRTFDYIVSDDYKSQLTNKITQEIAELQAKRGDVINRVEDFKKSNILLSYLKDNTDLESCPIPESECCEFNDVIVAKRKDSYNDDVVYLKPSDVSENILEKTKPITLSTIPKEIKPFMPLIQQKAIVGTDELWGILDNLKSIISEMPSTYQTEGVKPNEKIAYLHYFYGNSDWYIVEKDMGDGDDVKQGLGSGLQHQAFGYSILNGDTQDAEWGYISIEELKNTNKVELDFYFEPKPMYEVLPEIFESPKQPIVDEQQDLKDAIDGLKAMLDFVSKKEKAEYNDAIEALELLLE